MCKSGPQISGGVHGPPAPLYTGLEEGEMKSLESFQSVGEAKCVQYGDVHLVAQGLVVRAGPLPCGEFFRRGGPVSGGGAEPPKISNFWQIIWVHPYELFWDPGFRGGRRPRAPPPSATPLLPKTIFGSRYQRGSQRSLTLTYILRRAKRS